MCKTSLEYVTFFVLGCVSSSNQNEEESALDVQQ